MDNDIVITRVLDAPRSDVFKAWTDPERMKPWWGPNGFTMPYCKIDLRRRARADRLHGFLFGRGRQRGRAFDVRNES
jgi:uncharacterized protein YndB with AHSA1/START domain